jgi:hypothetical protein
MFQEGDLVVAKNPARMRETYKDWAKRYPDERIKYELGLKFADGAPLEIIRMRGATGVVIGPVGSSCTDNDKTLWLNSGDLALCDDMQPVSDLL